MRQYADAWFLVTIGYSIQGIFTFTDGIPIWRTVRSHCFSAMFKLSGMLWILCRLLTKVCIFLWKLMRPPIWILILLSL
jgi:hypothetical protein